MLAADRGNVIEAIKITRQKTGRGLKDAKAAVEQYLARNPSTNERFRAAQAGQRAGLLRTVALAALIILLAMLGYLWL